MILTMIPVSSSNLVAVGYDHASQTLRVQFNSGTYDYFFVPVHLYQGLLNASSKGSYLDTYIKKGGYRFSKV